MGNEDKDIKWYVVYRELAKLLAKTNGTDFYQQCSTYKSFNEKHKWAEKFKERKNPSFDPINIFASFNGFGMIENKRIEKINLYFKILGSNTEYENIDFSGCPSPVMIGLVSSRNEDSQKEIWDFFNDIMADNNNLEKHFDKFKNWYGIKEGSFTMFLFWIDSNNFLPLDKNTMALLETYSKIETIPKKYEEYEKLLVLDEERKKYKNKCKSLYANLALIAFDKNNIEKLSLNEKDDVFKYLGKKNTNDLKESILPVNKFLKIKSIKLDKDYRSLKIGIYSFTKEDNIDLYSADHLKVSINAIVGKNGSGKSTLVELFLKALCFINCEEVNDLPDMEIIFETTKVYKIKIKNNKIEKNFDFKEKGFFNLLVNYSIHGLNSSNRGNEWVNQIDKCKYIAIEPKRDEGNIDINDEEEILKKRLIENLLEPEYSLRKLIPLKAEKFRFKKLKEDDDNFNGLAYCEILKELYSYESINIVDLSATIQKEIAKNEKLTIKDLLPPAFLKTNILSENEVEFSQLSSGEKQKIYAINSIIHHIKEIDREYKYKYINLILDEIELYFHPELQRTYINDIVQAIKKVGTDNIRGINITFITHSPFILSDIPESKILFLDRNKDREIVSKENSLETFGANIHTLLSDSFFMEDGLMGEFAKGRINEIKTFYEKVIAEKKTEENQKFYKENQKKFWQIQKIIGEPFLQKIVQNQLEEVELILLGKHKAIDNEIKRLQELKKSVGYD